MIVLIDKAFQVDVDDGKFYQLKPNVRYGFGNKKVQAKLTGQYHYQSAKKALWQFSGGRFVEQINSESTLGNLGNTISTFLQEENFLKIYENSHFKIGHSFAPQKDFLLTTTLSWNNRSPLKNLARYEDEESEFTSNIPVNNELANTEFSQHQAFLWDAQIRWQLGHTYIYQRGNLKSVSPYPAISIIYKGGAKILGSDVAFQKIALQITQTFNTGIWGTGQFLLETGDFINRDDLTFIDFQHFNGKRTVYGSFNVGDFQLLDYYQYSTTGYYLQGHYEHQWNGATKKNKRISVKPIVAAHYLYTPDAGHYWELGVGLNKLIKFWRVDFYNSWRDGKRESSGVRIGIVID